MSNFPTFPFNDLPYELQREVFCQAAFGDSRNILKLVLVARRVNTWLQPLVYEMVTLGAEDTNLFIRTVKSRPPDFFAVHVKRLCLAVSVSAENATQILRVCAGVVRLAIWADFSGALPESPAGPLISGFPLRQLSIEYLHFLDILDNPGSPPPAWYTTLTHLDIVFWTDEESPAIEGLHHLISLTHLALGLRHRDVNEDSLFAILSNCPQLRILVILVEEGDSMEENIPSIDPRILYLPYPSVSVVQNWEAPWKGLPDTWSRAEEMLLHRQERANGMALTQLVHSASDNSASSSSAPSR